MIYVISIFYDSLQYSNEVHHNTGLITNILDRLFVSLSIAVDFKCVLFGDVNWIVPATVFWDTKASATEPIQRVSKMK